MARIAVVVASVLTLVVASGCRTPMGSAKATPTPGGQAASIHTLSSRFSPGILILEPGGSVRVTVHNSSVVSHTFTVGEPTVDLVVGPGQSEHVTFVPPVRPTSFICRFHEADGMKGTLCLRGQECIGQRLS
ncbi:MAG TPA: cupredoxin domain-containing protein [Acidimicrobiales bacterium]|jgi:plastocyanin